MPRKALRLRTEPRSVKETNSYPLTGSAFGPFHRTRRLRKLTRPAEARDNPLAIADQFATEWRIPFQLACYCCKLGQKKEALNWQEPAVDVAGRTDIRTNELGEPALESLWLDIAKIQSCRQ